MVSRDLTINISPTLNRLRLFIMEYADTGPGCPRPTTLKLADSSVGENPGPAYRGTVSKLGRMNEHVSTHG